MNSDMNIRMVFEAIDRVTRPLQKIGGAVQRIAGSSGLGKVTTAARRVSLATKGVVSEFQRLGKRGVIAATAAAGAILAVAKSFSNAGDSAAKASRRLGLNIEWLQRHRYAARLAGIEQNTFDMAMQRFTRRSAEAADGTGEAQGALKFLKVELKDAEGKMRPTEELLADVADRLSEIEDPALRVRIAFKLFDAEGVSMVNMLGEGSAAMAELAGEADRLGIVISEKAAREAEAFNDGVSRLMFSIQGLRNAIGVHLLPILLPLVDQFREWAIVNREVISAKVKEFVERVAAALPAFIEHVSDAARAVANIGRVIWDLFEPIGGAKTMITLLAILLSGSFLVSVIAATKALVALGAAILTTPIGWFAAAVVAVAVAGILLYRNWNRVISVFDDLWAKYRKFAAALLLFPATWFIGAIIMIARAGLTLYRNWEEVGTFFDQLWARLRAGALGVKLVFLDVVGSIVSAIADLVGALPEFVTTRIGLGGVDDLAKRVAEARRETQSRQAQFEAIGRDRDPGEVKVSVDFNNMPPGARVRSERVRGAELNLNAGYSMVSP